MGSPHKDGNTATLLKPFIKQLKDNSQTVELIEIYYKTIKACIGCLACQEIPDLPGCLEHDDMNPIYESILKADCIIFATPIYSWFCTPPMKAAIDRLFALNKFYGKLKNSSLWEGKKIALIATCGYETENGADLLEEALQRLCRHSHLSFSGTLAVRNINGIVDFKTDETIAAAKDFAMKISLLKN